MDPEKLKLLMKRAVFTGKTFLRHTENVASIIDDVWDEELIDLFSEDKEASDLLDEWEDLREHLSQLCS